MPNPDQLVARKGEDATLRRVTDPSYDSYDTLDDDNSTIETPTIQVIPSQPREEDVVALQGRGKTPSIRFTVDSSTDVRADREGEPDRITHDGTTYQVEEVRDDTHPMTGTQKKTVLCTSFDGA